MKKRKHDLRAWLVGLSYILVALAVGALACGFAYLIATSDLPGWLKFWLLK
jgi:hypothetical protein